MDYDGVFLEIIQISTIRINIRTLAVFGDFLYAAGLEIIQEVNVAAGVVYRNISLPEQRFHVDNIFVLAQSQYPTGEKQNLYIDFSSNHVTTTCKPNQYEQTGLER